MVTDLSFCQQSQIATVVLHHLCCIKCTSLKQTYMGLILGNICLVYFVKPLELHRAKCTKHVVGLLEALFYYFQKRSELPEEHPGNSSGKVDFLRGRCPQDKPVKMRGL